MDRHFFENLRKDLAVEAPHLDDFLYRQPKEDMFLGCVGLASGRQVLLSSPDAQNIPPALVFVVVVGSSCSSSSCCCSSSRCSSSCCCRSSSCVVVFVVAVAVVVVMGGLLLLITSGQWCC